MQHPLRPEWDTPPDGDFASYVERLSRMQHPAHSLAPGEEPGHYGARPTVVGTAAKGATVKAPVRDAVTRPASLTMPGAQGLRLLRLARAVLLLLVLAKAVAWLAFAWGSLFGVVSLGLLWWGLGAAGRLLSGGSPSSPGTDRAAALQTVLEALRQAARQPPNSRFPKK
ncbi:hypothetical protein [Acidovorax sp. BLS4]|uniref:hypothetical protein n=1 Tax=Acidovorax sp. BLS4 TaxID=3273430 RepID=UPI002943BA9A|nr:hypothetical protein [Paracidovorax avenae]WOI47653.1 hypothetical protein R1Z03_10755 [Paracidovorax avenae]